MKPPLTNPPPGLEWGTDYDTPQTYARIGRALMLFLFNLPSNPEINARVAWLSEGVAKTNGAMLFDEAAMTVDPSADPSHWMNPRGSWGESTVNDDEEEEDAMAALVEWRCGWCGAENDTAEAKTPCGSNRPRRVTRS